MQPTCPIVSPRLHRTTNANPLAVTGATRQLASMGFTTRRAEPSEAEPAADLNGIVQRLHHEQRPDWFKAPDPVAFLHVVRA